MTKVIYLLGSGRNGSTLVANLLGSIPGAVSVGEMYYLWDRGFVENRLCGCGVAFRSCEFWQAVTERAGIDPETARRGLELRQVCARTRHAVRPPPGELVEEFRGLLGRVYAAVSEVAKADVVVDSSKVPVYGRVLDRVESVSLHPVLLVRDPRGVVYSWSSPKPDPGSPTGEMSPVGPVRASLMWTAWNALALHYWRGRLSVARYEDFAQSPGSILSDLLARLDPVGPECPMPDVAIRRAHTVSGNPVRFISGDLTIEPDERWRRYLKLGPRMAATVLTLPLLRRFDYPLWRANG